MQEQDLVLTMETDDGARVLHVVGELDLSTVGAFEAELDQLHASARVVVVLSECTFIDSSALRSLVRAQHAVTTEGGKLALVAPTQPARRVLEVAALDRFLPVFDTLADAVTSTA